MQCKTPQSVRDAPTPRRCSPRAQQSPLCAGKPTGEAYVEFSTAEEAQRALKDRQHQHIGSRYIE